MILILSLSFATDSGILRPRQNYQTITVEPTRISDPTVSGSTIPTSSSAFVLEDDQMELNVALTRSERLDVDIYQPSGRERLRNTLMETPDSTRLITSAGIAARGSNSRSTNRGSSYGSSFNEMTEAPIQDTDIGINDKLTLIITDPLNDPDNKNPIRLNVHKEQMLYLKATNTETRKKSVLLKKDIQSFLHHRITRAVFISMFVCGLISTLGDVSEEIIEDNNYPDYLKQTAAWTSLGCEFAAAVIGVSYTVYKSNFKNFKTSEKLKLFASVLMTCGACISDIVYTCRLLYCHPSSTEKVILYGSTAILNLFSTYLNLYNGIHVHRGRPITRHLAH